LTFKTKEDYAEIKPERYRTLFVSLGQGIRHVAGGN